MRCANESIPAVIISGNHDSPDRIAVGKSLLARHGIHIITELKDAFTPVRGIRQPTDFPAAVL